MSVDIRYLEALFAEMAIPHVGISSDDGLPTLYKAYVGKMPRDVLIERLERIGFHNIVVGSEPTRQGWRAVRFQAIPKGRVEHG